MLSSLEKTTANVVVPQLPTGLCGRMSVALLLTLGHVSRSIAVVLVQIKFRKSYGKTLWVFVLAFPGDTISQQTPGSSGSDNLCTHSSSVSSEP